MVCYGGVERWVMGEDEGGKEEKLNYLEDFRGVEGSCL